MGSSWTSSFRRTSLFPLLALFSSKCVTFKYPTRSNHPSSVSVFLRQHILPMARPGFSPPCPGTEHRCGWSWTGHFHLQERGDRREAPAVCGVQQMSGGQRTLMRVPCLQTGWPVSQRHHLQRGNVLEKQAWHQEEQPSGLHQYKPVDWKATPLCWLTNSPNYRERCGSFSFAHIRNSFLLLCPTGPVSFPLTKLFYKEKRKGMVYEAHKLNSSAPKNWGIW